MRVSETWLDILSYLDRSEVEKCQLLAEFHHNVIEKSGSKLPLRRMSLVTVTCSCTTWIIADRDSNAGKDAPAQRYIFTSEGLPDGIISDAVLDALAQDPDAVAIAQL
ncbi:hypothetical protein AAVH_18980 [Aphelenchoides avenae]|nr:hypothetical protein AAVH_18980 [Aphelenchus avenae]